MTCPICKAKNVTAAHILGHGGKGKAKTITKADRLGRSERMKALNLARSAKKTNDSDQTPRTQDVANTTDSLERLSASVLFVPGSTSE